MSPCPYCGETLAAGPPWAPGDGHRLAFDPIKGRLWNVCSQCSRWTLTPLDSRWETLEACEAATRKEGTVLFSTPQLSLVRLAAGELIRVGNPPRPEFVDWRYVKTLAGGNRKAGFWTRLLARLPAPPVGGYDPYRGFEGAVQSAPWIASPFLESASLLTYLFSQVPLAPTCLSCREPMALEPWAFQNIEFVLDNAYPAVLAPCGLCHTKVAIPLGQARPALRIGLGLVTARDLLRGLAPGAAEALDSVGGSMGFLKALSRSRGVLGELDPPTRSGLIISLDEMAEMEALEAEWREAEEMASIMDGELSDVPGFLSFRQEILGEEG